MKLNGEIIHDKEAKNIVFYRVLYRIEKLENEIQTLEQKSGLRLSEYKDLQHKKVELATLEEFFEGKECNKYIVIEDQEND